MRLESINRVLLPSFLGDVEFEEALSRYHFKRIEVVLCSIGEVCCKFQVVKKKVYRPFLDTTLRGSRLDLCSIGGSL